MSLPQVKISRVTLEPYCFKTGDELVVAWALCTNGSLLYRHGVTPNKPQGEEWVRNNSQNKHFCKIPRYLLNQQQNVHNFFNSGF